MDQELLLFCGFGTLLAGALLAFVLRGEGGRATALRYVALLATLGACACFVSVAARVLLSGNAVGPIVLGHLGLLNASFSLRVDALSAFFLLLISALSAAASWYAVAYTRKLEGGLGGFYAPFLLFIFGMAGVVVVDDFFFFFVPWEFMALSSYLLVVYHRSKPENLSAGFKYFFITHAGTLALFIGVALLATGGTGSFGFSDLAAALPGLLEARPLMAHGALLLILLGFLVKAGGYPFGAWWLPDAHPAAPSPVSALLSGAMIKLGLYGILRVFFGMLPTGPWSLKWGFLIALFGTLSLFFGTLSALVQHDSKRLLAYHSIGQVGYVLLGFGIGLGLAPTNPALAAVGLIGGLFHLLNHGCFKGLLFLNAGAFEFATGERDLNALGGLNRLLPATALCTVVASLSIAGLPPFNGFSSKWLLYHASVWGSRGWAVFYLFFGIVAIFISAVTLASFLKFMGATIWGAPSPKVREAPPVREWPWLAPGQLFLALLCLLFGLFPFAGLWLCYAATRCFAGTLGLPAFEQLFGSWLPALQVSDSGVVVGLWSPLVVGCIFLAAFALALVVRRLAAAPKRAVAVWSCGSDVPPDELRFRADHYYTPFKKFVHAIVPEWRPPWQPRAWPWVPKALSPDGWAYLPLADRTVALFRWFARSRVGFPQVYPAWLLIGLGASFLCLFLLWLRGP